MAEYKSRRERRHAQGGKIGGPGHPTAHKGPVLVIGLIKKKKDGGHVEGEKARHHLGKRARGGRTTDTEHKVLDAREAAFDSDGIDKVAVGSGKDEREVPIERRADGGPVQKPKFETDDDSSKDMGNLTPARRDTKNEYTNDEDKRAKGGRLTAGERHKMPSSEFALPGKGEGPGGKGAGSYPINDSNHARNALARVSQHGTASEKAKVRAAVHRKFPGIHESE